ncbi:MAG TPA: hypothetical protein VGJ97_07395 [Anaerolineaceae bacterium]|jgi:hypothetical protein
MSSNRPKTITTVTPGFLHDISMRVKLILRLMGDSRVSPFLKLIPIGAVLYALWPIDIPGPFDDAAVLLLGSGLFVELCPSAVVQEHMNQLHQTSPIDWEKEHPTGDVVDGEFRETTPPPQK